MQRAALAQVRVKGPGYRCGRRSFAVRRVTRTLQAPPSARVAEKPSAVVATACLVGEIELISLGPSGRGVDWPAVARGPVVLVVAVEIFAVAVRARVPADVDIGAELSWTGRRHRHRNRRGLKGAALEAHCPVARTDANALAPRDFAPWECLAAVGVRFVVAACVWEGFNDHVGDQKRGIRRERSQRAHGRSCCLDVRIHLGGAHVLEGFRQR